MLFRSLNVLQNVHNIITITVVDELQYVIDEYLKYFFVIGNISIYKSMIIFVISLMRNDMSTTFLQQILSNRLLLIVIIGTKK